MHSVVRLKRSFKTVRDGKFEPGNGGNRRKRPSPANERMVQNGQRVCKHLRHPPVFPTSSRNRSLTGQEVVLGSVVTTTLGSMSTTRRVFENPIPLELFLRVFSSSSCYFLFFLVIKLVHVYSGSIFLCGLVVTL